MSDSNQSNLTDKNGKPVEVIEAYLCSDKVWVRNDDGSSKVIKTSELRRR